MSFAQHFQAPRNTRRYPTGIQQDTFAQGDALRDRSLSEVGMMEDGFHRIGTTGSIMEGSDAARARAGEMSTVNEGILGRQNRALGGASERQQLAQNKRMGMRRSLTETAKGNRSIVGEMERGQMVDDYMYDQRNLHDEASLSMMGMASDVENQRNVDTKIRRARRSARRIGALGTIAGIGLAAMTGGASAAAMTALGGAGRG